MKRYVIIHNFTATASIEVLANSREEAFVKAQQNELNLSDYNFELDSAEIGHEEEIPDLDELIQQAESIVKQADKEDTDIILSPWPLVTVEHWDGYRMEHEHQRMNNIYWDYEADEIGFNTDESGGNFTLGELPEIEQYNLCQAIIKSKNQ